jgi:AcrR family transcriptional regulator
MAIDPLHSGREIPTMVKDASLVAEKRQTIVDASVKLFVQKGFHSTTTREIAGAAGMSIGSLYEYVASKEDVLYLVCDSIHKQMEAALEEAIDESKTPLDALTSAMSDYITVCDRMQDSILLIYRETASLDAESQSFVLKNEQRIANLFENLLRRGVTENVFTVVDDKALQLMAHNIVVLGHMWAYRRWFLRDVFAVEEFIRHQTSLVVGELTGSK